MTSLMKAARILEDQTTSSKIRTHPRTLRTLALTAAKRMRARKGRRASKNRAVWWSISQWRGEIPADPSNNSNSSVEQVPAPGSNPWPPNVHRPNSLLIEHRLAHLCLVALDILM